MLFPWPWAKKAAVAPSTVKKAPAASSSRRPLARTNSTYQPSRKATTRKRDETYRSLPVPRTAPFHVRKAIAEKGFALEELKRKKNAALFTARRSIITAQVIAPQFLAMRGRVEIDAAQCAEFAAARASPAAAAAFVARAEALRAQNVLQSRAHAEARRAEREEVERELAADDEAAADAELRACESVLALTTDTFVADCVRERVEERLREAQEVLDQLEALAAEEREEAAREERARKRDAAREQNKAAAELDPETRKAQAQERIRAAKAERERHIEERRRARPGWQNSAEAAAERWAQYIARIAEVRRLAQDVLKNRSAYGAAESFSASFVSVSAAFVEEPIVAAPIAEDYPVADVADMDALDVPAAEPEPVIDEREAERQRFNGMLRLINEETAGTYAHTYGVYKWKWDYLKAGLTRPGTFPALSLPWPLDYQAIPLFNDMDANSDAISAAIAEFVLCEQRPGYEGMGRRQRAKDELSRWHPDKFVASYLPLVCAHEREGVAKAVHLVAVALTGLLKSG